MLAFSKQNCNSKLMFSFFLLTVLLFVSISGFIGHAAGANYASLASVSTYWPDRVLDPGQSTTAKVIVKQSIMDAFLEPEIYFSVNLVSLHVSAEADGNIVAMYTSEPRRDIELIGEFEVPLTIASDAKPGKHNFFTLVKVTVFNRAAGSWDPGLAAEVKDQGSIWIGGEEDKEVTESSMGVSVALKAVFPTMAEAGETITGKATIIPDATIQTFGGTFTVDASQITFPGLGITKVIAKPGTTFSGPQTFTVTVTIPSDAEEKAYSWTATATGTGRAMFMKEQRTVNVGGSLNVIRPSSEGAGELDCIIATAAFGSRMDTNVEAMRHLRDNSVKITFTGGNFMKVFNGWYYSWSPAIAKAVHDHESLRSITRVILYPVVGSVIVAQGTISIFSFSIELAATASILTAAFICGVFYIAPLTLLIGSLGKRMNRMKSSYILKRQDIMLLVCGVMSGFLTFIGVVANSSLMNTVGVTVLALIVTLSAAAITVKALTRINVLMKTTLTK